MRGSPERVSALAVAAVLAAAIAWAPVPGVAYVDRAPPGHTGGFGEPTCAGCHSDSSVGSPGGSLELAAPAWFAPGEDHVLEVRLARAGMRRAGFQLSARYAEGDGAGAQAGRLRPADDAVEIVVAHRVAYAGHTTVGAAAARNGEASFRVVWTAPGEPSGPVAFHVAANAADFDDSEYGDFVYLASAVSEPR